MAERPGYFDVNSRYNKAMGVPGTPELVPIGAASQRTTAALNSNSAYEWMVDADCHVNWQASGSGSATTSNMKYMAGERGVIVTPMGSAFYVAAIQAAGSTGGNLYLSELTPDRMGY
jgi:hypothetical protein